LPTQETRHAGDLGNLEADGDGNARLSLTVKNLDLCVGPRGILGRSVIVHPKPDDGSQPTGDAGGRIGAGVIGIAKDAERSTKGKEHSEADATTGGDGTRRRR
jgi:Cu-Zn family superoxide dismutase